MASSKGLTYWESVISPLQAKISGTLNPTDFGRHCVSRGLIAHDELRNILSIRSHSDAMRIDDLLSLLYQTGDDGYNTFKDILHEWSHLPLHAYSRLLKTIEQKEAEVAQRKMIRETTFVAQKETNGAPPSAAANSATFAQPSSSPISAVTESQPPPLTVSNSERPQPAVEPSDTSLLPPGKDPGRGKQFFVPNSASETERRTMSTTRSRLFRQIGQAFSEQWKAIVDYLIGVDERRLIEMAPTGRANAPSNEDLFFDGLCRWSGVAEEPTGKELYDAIFFAVKGRHVVRKLLAPLELPDWYEPEAYF